MEPDTSAPDAPTIVLQMSSFPTKSHRDWPVERFAELASLLLRERPRARLVVAGDEHARRAAAPFMALHAGHSLLVAGRTTLRESAAIISLADLYVGVDTGPTHIAGALGVPMVALYHCEYPGRNLAPLDHPRCRVIEHPATGGDCSDARMADIPVKAVHEQARTLLGEPAIAAGACA